MIEVAEHHKSLSDEEWVQLLKRSVRERSIDGITFPGFPEERMQVDSVGSANETSLDEAFAFYSLVKNYSKGLGNPLSYTESSLLDFGCAWGRYLRFFWRDISPHNLHGVDIRQDLLNIARKTGVQAHLQQIDPQGQLPFESKTFSHIIAYSVFTHLPEQIQEHWLSEIFRVARPGCIFICTTEPRRFLDWIDSEPTSDWHRSIKSAVGDLDVKKNEFDAGKYVFIPSGGGIDMDSGKVIDSSIYGDAVIPEPYIRSKWGKLFSVHEYIDDPERFLQAVVVCQKRITNDVA